MLAPLSSPIVQRLAGVAVVVGVVAGIYGAGVSAGKAKITPDRDAWRTTARSYLASAKAWEASYRASQRVRGIERGAAIDAVTKAGQACDARVSAARRSAAAIQSIVAKEVRYDESRCPVRAVVGSGELRDALGLAADHR